MCVWFCLGGKQQKTLKPPILGGPPSGHIPYAFGYTTLIPAWMFNQLSTKVISMVARGPAPFVLVRFTVRTYLPDVGNEHPRGFNWFHPGSGALSTIRTPSTLSAGSLDCIERMCNQGCPILWQWLIFFGVGAPFWWV